MTRTEIAQTFADKLDWLDHRNHRLGGGNISDHDPQHIANEISRHADILIWSVAGRHDRGTAPIETANELGGRLVGLIESLIRADELRVDAGDEPEAA